MSQAIIVPLSVKALTNEQLLALYNRWSTKPCKKFEKRGSGEQRVAKLLADLEMDVDQACAPPSGDGYAGDGWDAAFPGEEPAGPPEATVEEPASPELEQAPAEPTEPCAEATEPQPRIIGNTILAIGGLPENSDPMHWAPDLAKKLKCPIHILSLTGELLQTVQPTTAKQRSAKPRSEEMSKSGKAVFDLVSRHEGATAKELLEATGWAQGSWPPLCNRLARQKAMRFHQQKVDGVTRYYLSDGN